MENHMGNSTQKESSKIGQVCKLEEEHLNSAVNGAQKSNIVLELLRVPVGEAYFHGRADIDPSELPKDKEGKQKTMMPIRVIRQHATKATKKAGDKQCFVTTFLRNGPFGPGWYTERKAA